MPQEATNLEEKDFTQVMDEIGIKSTQENIRQLQAEVSTFSENLEQIEKTLTDNPKRFEVNKKLIELQLVDNGFLKINPVNKYETYPEYAQYMSEVIKMKLDDELHSFELNQKKLTIQRDELKKQLESSQKLLDEQTMRLRDAGVDVE
jgi:hypothetical protein